MIELDILLFRWMNFDGGAFLDSALYLISTRYFAIPIYLYLLYRLFKGFRPVFFHSLIAVALMVLVSDQLSVAVKNATQRKRPCHEQTLQTDVHLVDGRCGGMYGYYSSHASNTMALMVFLSLVFKNRNITLFLGIWAAIVGYSRIYLGAHYPFDVLSGWIAGALLGWITYLGLTRLTIQKT